MQATTFTRLWTGVCLTFMVGVSAAQPPAHFDPKGKPPSEHTRALQAAQRAQLPFDDARDFDESRRGLLAEPPYRQILGANLTPVWDMDRYAFLLDGQDFDSIHPSLQRQATLNMNYGLYEVVPDFLYQVRGFDLANMTLVKGERGWIVFDTLLTRETAAAALGFANQHLGERPVTAVVYSHSHVDHYGGVLGVVTREAVAAGEVAIYAPAGFLAEAVSESVYAGTAMGRRATYQYGNLLPRSPFGQVDSAIGKALARGTSGLVAPTVEIAADFETHVIDGVRIEFQNTPGTEAPAEMNAWFPDHKVLWGAENLNATVHNIYTLRGALVRDALLWSKHINAALYRYGQDAEVLVTSHNWPRWDNARIQEVLRAQRDAYANLNNQVLRLANQGVTIHEIHNEYQVPPALQQQWPARQYHGSEFHNARAVINRYLGYWDGNPATLTPLSPAESAPLYVEMMGGAGPILARAQALHDAGEYRLAMELLNRLVYAEPHNTAAKDLLADVFEQLGYQYESASLRNVFLSAASELRNGMAAQAAPRGTSPEVTAGLSTSQFLDLLAIRLDDRAAGDTRLTFNLLTPDTGEQFVIELSNGTLSHVAGYQVESADATVRIDRAQLTPVITGEATLMDQIRSARGVLVGRVAALEQLESLLVNFDAGFEILPGTGA